ncbi:hypothetical protein LZC95_18455 [Pendulispora brunnea]|uniref:Transposase n=1 Tax=Pendulispora brunnea TaxID=2905690 RepID=A0ABZ2KM99_9BACT
MRKRAKRPEWEKRIAGWKASEEDAADYAKKHGWNPRTLVWWDRRITAESKAAEAAKGFVEIIPSEETFAAKMPVEKVVAMLSSSTPYRDVEVILRSGRVLRVQTGGSAAALRDLLGVLEES